MKKSIIVGCNGQDGKLLYEFLSKKGYELIGIGRNQVRCEKHADMNGVNITSTKEVYELINNFKPDEIYHLAAFHHSSEDSPLDNIELYQNSFNINTFSLINFLEGIKRYSPTTRLFYAASSHIFGDAGTEGLQDENTPINPHSIYGITKAAGLFACRFYRNNYSVFASTGILYNHESSFRDPKFVSKKIIKGVIDIKNGRQNELILGSLDAEIDWGYAPDYVDAMFRILNASTADDYVIATGKKHTILEFVKLSFEYMGMDWKTYIKEKPGLITRKNTSLVGNPTKLKTVTGWKPSVSFSQMIKILLDEEVKFNA